MSDEAQTIRDVLENVCEACTASDTRVVFALAALDVLLAELARSQSQNQEATPSVVASSEVGTTIRWLFDRAQERRLNVDERNLGRRQLGALEAELAQARARNEEASKELARVMVERHALRVAHTELLTEFEAYRRDSAQKRARAKTNARLAIERARRVLAGTTRSQR